MKPAIAIAALAGLTTTAHAQNIATITLTASTTMADIGETVTIGAVLTDNITGNSVWFYDVEVASAGSMSIAGITAPTHDVGVGWFEGAATSTGATGLGGSIDILGPNLDPSLDDVTVYTFQFTLASAGSRTFTAMDGDGPFDAVRYAIEGGIVMLPVEYDEYVFVPITVHAVPGPTTLTLLALAPIVATQRRR